MNRNYFVELLLCNICKIIFKTLNFHHYVFFLPNYSVYYLFVKLFEAFLDAVAIVCETDLKFFHGSADQLELLKYAEARAIPPKSRYRQKTKSSHLDYSTVFQILEWIGIIQFTY